MRKASLKDVTPDVIGLVSPNGELWVSDGERSHDELIKALCEAGQFIPQGNDPDLLVDALIEGWQRLEGSAGSIFIG